MTKHTYREGEAPTNTGSLSRPARFNMRLTCSSRARTHAVFQNLRTLYRLPHDASYADVWEDVGLLVLEHVVRQIVTGETAISQMFMSLGKPLPQRDHLRAKYEQLKFKFG